MIINNVNIIYTFATFQKLQKNIKSKIKGKKCNKEVKLETEKLWKILNDS